ncbi:LysR family transcriptional regulator [Paenarthrobacter sp. NPDC089316]|uniref:LysR family transcriptional regulator n=1 Tax=unclassified Paenarthrobacter TaxID=2634190 RepID=UPI003433BC04
MAGMGLEYVNADVELRHLRAFAAVAMSGSYTAASKDLLITQPALTRTVQQLEAVLGTRLLDRNSRSVGLTPTGEVFLSKVLAILSDVDRAVLSVKGHQELRLGFQWILPVPWATEVISEFERNSSATVILMRRDDVASHLERAELDVAITRTRLSPESFVHTQLFEEERVAVVSTSSSLADRDSIDWLELAEHPIVVNVVNGTTRAELWPVDRRPRQVVTCGNYDEWLSLVVAGRGVGALPSSAARATSHPQIRFIPLTGAPPVSVWLVYQPRRQNPLVRKFVALAMEVRERLSA